MNMAHMHILDLLDNQYVDKIVSKVLHKFAFKSHGYSQLTACGWPGMEQNDLRVKQLGQFTRITSVPRWKDRAIGNPFQSVKHAKNKSYVVISLNRSSTWPNCTS